MNGLVLSGGGARAAYQVGVLSYMAEKVPEARFPIITGVSAGAINAVFLAGHRGTPRETLEALSDLWTGLSVEEIFRTDPGSIGLTGARWFWMLGAGGMGPKVRGLLDTEPLRGFLSKNLDAEGIAEKVKSGRLRALALTATRYSTGQTVTFVQGQEDAPIWERSRRIGVRTRIEVSHVMASGSIPLVFPAIKVADEYYGDGSIRQAAPLAPAIHLGADRLVAISTRYAPTLVEIQERSTSDYPPPAQIIGMLFNTIFLDTLESDAERLHRINEILDSLPAGAPHPDGLRKIRLLVVRPSRDLGNMAEGYRRQLPRSLRFMLRGLGIQRLRGPELLSYLLFEMPYLANVMELGYEDTMSQWHEVERFFEEESRV